MPETKDLILRKAVFEDWESLYRQVWSQPETARYMAWDLTASEEEARARMERTLAFQASHDFHWPCASSPTSSLCTTTCVALSEAPWGWKASPQRRQ